MSDGDWYGIQADAATLAIAMANVHDAKDACVTAGRHLRGTDAERGMPDHGLADAAVQALDDLRHAERELESASMRWRRRRAVAQ